MRGSAVPTIVWSRELRNSTSSTAPSTARRARGASVVAAASWRAFVPSRLPRRTGRRPGTAAAPRRLPARRGLPRDLPELAAADVVHEAADLVAVRHERA